MEGSGCVCDSLCLHMHVRRADGHMNQATFQSILPRKSTLAQLRLCYIKPKKKQIVYDMYIVVQLVPDSLTGKHIPMPMCFQPHNVSLYVYSMSITLQLCSRLYYV